MMTLKEYEVKIEELNDRIKDLLKERENMLKEWNNLFDTEKIQQTKCVDEVNGSHHNIYIIHGESRKFICEFSENELEWNNINEFYRYINTSIRIRNIVEKRELDLPEWQEKLVYAQIAHIRQVYEDSNKKYSA